MGSEGKSRKRRSSASPSPTRDEDERVSKHRKRDDREKMKKKKKKKSERSHKHSRSRDGNEKKSGKKHKIMKIQELSGDDYYSKNNEFSTWLKEEKGLFFSNLSSEAARDLFSSFVKKWNSQKLDPEYYEGIARGPRTTHNWNIRQGKDFSGP